MTGDTEAGIAGARNQPGTPVLGRKLMRYRGDPRGREGTQAENEGSQDTRAGVWQGLSLSQGGTSLLPNLAQAPIQRSPSYCCGRTSWKKEAEESPARLMGKAARLPHPLLPSNRFPPERTSTVEEEAQPAPLTTCLELAL